MFKLFIVLSGALLGFSTLSAHAESPLERAAKIKEWRANCSDPDPDLRLAYIEGAIATNDRTIIRACVRQTLNSQNEDVRNLALRAALAASERLTMMFDMPESYREAVAKAGGDPAKLKTITKKYTKPLWPHGQMNGLVTLVAKSTAFESQVSEWFVLGTNAKEMDAHTAKLTIFGNSISGNGTINISNYVGKLLFNLSLDKEGMLVGTGNIYYGENYTMKIKLF